MCTGCTTDQRSQPMLLPLPAPEQWMIYCPQSKSQHAHVFRPKKAARNNPSNITKGSMQSGACLTLWIRGRHRGAKKKCETGDKRAAHLNKLVTNRDVGGGGASSSCLLQGGACRFAKAAEHLLCNVANGVLHCLCPHIFFSHKIRFTCNILSLLFEAHFESRHSRTEKTWSVTCHCVVSTGCCATLAAHANRL